MSLNLDPVVITNLILAVAILVLGTLIYARKKESLALYVATGFGLFAVSHALNLLGYGAVSILIIPIRVLGYLVVVIGLIIPLSRAT